MIEGRLEQLYSQGPDWPGFLEPLWRGPDGLYESVIDEGGRVTGFSPFDPEMVDPSWLHPYKGPKKQARIGNAAAYAFMFQDAHIEVSAHGKLCDSLREVADALKNRPLLRVWVLEFIGDDDKMPEAIEAATAFLVGDEQPGASQSPAIEWAAEMRDQLAKRRALRLLGEVPAGSPWHHITAAHLETLPPASKDDLRAYTVGRPPDLRLLNATPALPQRRCVEAMLKGLENKRAILLTGSAGEGKSTALFQAAARLIADHGATVLLARSYGAELTSLPIINGPLAILVDEADLLIDRAGLVDAIEKRRQSGLPTWLVLAARTLEWQARPRQKSHRDKDLMMVDVGRLDDAEVGEVAVWLSALDLTAGRTSQQVAASLRQARVTDLLAAVLLTVHATDLRHILADVAAKLTKRPKAVELIGLLAATAAIEGRDIMSGTRRLSCSPGLLKELLQESPTAISALVSKLSGEVSRRGVIALRHPVIAREFYVALTTGSQPLVNADMLDEELVEAAGRCENRDPNAPERYLLVALPRLHRDRGNVSLARRLLDCAMDAAPRNIYVLQMAAVLEGEHGKPTEARRLFERATAVVPRHVQSWQAWALFESTHGDATEARRLFKQATTLDPRNAQSWQAWAVFEGAHGEATEARRLFKQATTLDPRDVKSWQAWAVFEGAHGEATEARRPFKQATTLDPRDVKSWRAWAGFEFKLDNIDEGLRLTRLGLALDPADPYLLDLLRRNGGQP